MMYDTDIAILGAGPIGLEAALAASDEGLDYLVFEAADVPAGNIRDWGHVRLFTPWTMNVSPRARARLEAEGRTVPNGSDCPTGHELAARVLDPVAELMGSRVRTKTRVVAVARDGLLKDDEIGSADRASRPFRVLVDGPEGEEVVRARVVIDCTGTYHNPNALGAGGIPAPGERKAAERIVRAIPDVGAEEVDWQGRRILVVGAGHSAQTAIVDLDALARRHDGTEVTWAVRSPSPVFEADPHDLLPARSGLHAAAGVIARGGGPVSVRSGVVVESLTLDDGDVVVTFRHSDGSTSDWRGDRVVALTGSVGDASLYRQLQVHECYATSGPMKLAASLLASGSSDCLQQVGHGAEVLMNPEPDFYILGSKSYGRNNSFLLRVGWEQIDDVFDTLLTKP